MIRITIDFGSYASMQAFTDANLSAPEINVDSDHAPANSVFENSAY